MRRLSANYIFPITSPPIKNGILEIDNNGKILNIIDTNGKLKESEGIELFNGILVPGFVNSHCHLELSYLKGKIKPQKGLAGFIHDLKDVKPSETSLIIASKAEFFDKLMWQNGIVAVGDISNDTVSFPIKQLSHIYYHTFIEFFGLEPKNASTIIKKSLKKEKTLQLFNLQGNISPHAPYSISPDLFSLFHNIDKNPKEIFSIHFQESQDNDKYFSSKSGAIYNLFHQWNMPYPFKNYYKNSLDYILHYLPKENNQLFVHNTYMKKSDLEKIHANFQNPFLCLCPNANLYIENILPDINLLKDSKIALVLGTDSLASNNYLSILEEMKTIQANYSISLDDLLTWATINGAKALNIESTFGSFEIGKNPGINFIGNIDLVHMKLLPESYVIKLV